MARGFERLMKDRATRDELLSAYLDDQLDAEDRARLEAHLAADSALRSELEMLRRTVALVRDLPPQPVPRNFILPREAAVPKLRPAPRLRPKWLAPFLTAATVVVSLLFVAVLAGDLLFSGVGGMAQLAAPAPSADEAAVESAPAERTAEEEETPKMLVITEAPEGEAAAEAPSEPGETPLAMELPATPPPAAGEMGEADVGEEAEPTSAPEGTPVPAAGGGEPGTESPVPTPTPEAARAADAAVPTSMPAPPPEPVTAEPTEQVLPVTQPAPNEVGETEPPAGNRDISSYVTPWRTVEVALGVAALLLLAATIWVWRARRR